MIKDREFIELEVILRNSGTEPQRAHIAVGADDEVAITVNDLPVLEAMEGRPHTERRVDVLLPPGLSEIRLVQHQLWRAGRWNFSSTVPWTCGRDFR